VAAVATRRQQAVEARVEELTVGGFGVVRQALGLLLALEQRRAQLAGAREHLLRRLGGCAHRRAA